MSVTTRGVQVPRKKKPPTSIPLKRYEREFAKPIPVPRERDYDDEEKTLIEARFRKVSMWEEFTMLRKFEAAKRFNKGGRRFAEERSWKVAVATLQDKLLDKEWHYTVGMEQADYAFMGEPEKWNQLLVDDALNKLRSKSHKPPREDWSWKDDMQWVWDNINVNTIKPRDFPSISAFNLLHDIRKFPEERARFKQEFMALMKALEVKKKPKEGEPEEEQQIEDIPLEETTDYKIAKMISDMFHPSKEANHET